MRPSIFNDVLGPVMRGPSSSHTAASWRIGKTAVALLGEPPVRALVEFDEMGGWAPNYEDQGTVIGMDGGLLGIDITDERIIDTKPIAAERGVEIEYRVSRFPTDHPNTVRLTLEGASGARLGMVAVSTGGGMFVVRTVDGQPAVLEGDWHDLLALAKRTPTPAERAAFEAAMPPDSRVEWTDGRAHVRSTAPVAGNLAAAPWVATIRQSPPVLPIPSGFEREIPYDSAATMLAYAETTGRSLGAVALEYEALRSGLSEAQVAERMETLIGIIEGSIATGLAGTRYDDRILGQQSHLVGQAERAGRIPPDPIMNALVANIAAIMEAKSAMQVIVAAPTAGGCGTLGGTIKAVADHIGSDRDTRTRAYFAAGMIGVWFAAGPGFSAEAGGCQLETGAAASMAAAALVELHGGTAREAVAAASMALQNTIGLVCDPVADRVEVPCLGKNVAAGSNARTASIMALSGFDPVIPLDEVIETVKSVAATMPRSLCCTGLGGLAATGTAHALKAELAHRKACARC